LKSNRFAAFKTVGQRPKFYICKLIRDVGFLGSLFLLGEGWGEGCPASIFMASFLVSLIFGQPVSCICSHLFDQDQYWTYWPCAFTGAYAQAVLFNGSARICVQLNTFAFAAHWLAQRFRRMIEKLQKVYKCVQTLMACGRCFLKPWASLCHSCIHQIQCITRALRTYFLASTRPKKRTNATCKKFMTL
jgi:hypothetical protein